MQQVSEALKLTVIVEQGRLFFIQRWCVQKGEFFSEFQNNS
jgi:hypothetical protein